MIAQFSSVCDSNPGPASVTLLLLDETHLVQYKGCAWQQCAVEQQLMAGHVRICPHGWKGSKSKQSLTLWSFKYEDHG